jgi:hypothetical protein
MGEVIWALLALGAAAFFFLRGFFRRARQIGLWAEARMAVRRWREGT